MSDDTKPELRANWRTIADLDEAGLRAMLEVYAKNWIAHDGCWFQSCEQRWDMPTAKAVNDATWQTFTRFEARRVLEFLGIEPGQGDLRDLAEALNFRLYASVNRQEIVEFSPTKLVFRMNECRVQAARRRKGMADYPCKSAGIVEYGGFAATVNPRIRTRCLACPPDPEVGDGYCRWEFTLDEKA